MKFISICYPGTEDICATEIRELCSVDSEQHENAVIFSTDEEKVIEYCYSAQTPIKVLSFLGYLQFENLQDILNHIKKIQLTGWINKDTKFKIKCSRIGDHNFSSDLVMKQVGEIFYEKDKLKVDLTTPNLIIYVHIYDNNCYIGINLTQTELSKRDYKMFIPATTIQGPIAYSLLRISNYHKDDILINLFTGSGIITIEAALFASKKSHNFYRKNQFIFDKLLPFKKLDQDTIFEELDKNISKDKLNINAFDETLAHLNFTQKNAKIAGVNKLINISKIEIEWLDTKLDKEEADKIISYLPCPSKRKTEKKISKIYKELFYQLDYVLKKDGQMITITKNNKLLKENAKEKHYISIHERKVFQGKEPFWINVFEKPQLI